MLSAVLQDAEACDFAVDIATVDSALFGEELRPVVYHLRDKPTKFLDIAFVKSERHICRQLLIVNLRVEVLQPENLLRRRLTVGHIADIVPLKEPRLQLKKQFLVVIGRCQIGPAYRIIGGIMKPEVVLL